MGTKYSSISAVGYNSSPPPDDGTAVDANKIVWGRILTKLTDVLKNYADAINSAILAALDFGNSSVVATYTTVAGDNGRTIEASGTFTISLGDATTMGAGYMVGIKNVGTGVITVTTLTNTDTIDGTAQLQLTILPGDYQLFKINAGNNGYIWQNSTFVLGPTGQCQLQFVDTTHVKLVPYNGNKIVINGVPYAIPSAGVTFLSTSGYIGGVASQAVAASTTYLVYAFTTVSAGAVTINLDLVTGGSHATDANTGVEIKTGDATRTLVGMVRTDASSHFSLALTLSWFNRLRFSLARKSQADTGAPNETFSNREADSTNRANFLCWTGGMVDAQGFGSLGGPADSWGLTVTTATFDTTVCARTGVDTNTDAFGYAFLCKSGLTEGLNYVTVSWASSGVGTATVSASFVGSVSP